MTTQPRTKLIPVCPFCYQAEYVLPVGEDFHCNYCGGYFDKYGETIDRPDYDEDIEPQGEPPTEEERDQAWKDDLESYGIDWRTL